MDLCSAGHDEVCYEARICPVCAILCDKHDEIESLQNKIESQELALSQAEEEISSLRDEIQSLKAE